MFCSPCSLIQPLWGCMGQNSTQAADSVVLSPILTVPQPGGRGSCFPCSKGLKTA
jgi:hypothetical protein